MKKNEKKLSLGKNTIVSLEVEMKKMIRGGLQGVTSESCPGADCPSEKHSCNPDCSQQNGCNIFN